MRHRSHATTYRFCSVVDSVLLLAGILTLAFTAAPLIWKSILFPSQQSAFEIHLSAKQTVGQIGLCQIDDFVPASIKNSLAQIETESQSLAGANRRWHRKFPTLHKNIHKRGTVICKSPFKRRRSEERR